MIFAEIIILDEIKNHFLCSTFSVSLVYLIFSRLTKDQFRRNFQFRSKDELMVAARHYSNQMTRLILRKSVTFWGW